MQSTIVSTPKTNDLTVMRMKSESDIQTYEEPVIHVKNCLVFQISVTNVKIK
jgi:hypothetical protein